MPLPRMTTRRWMVAVAIMGCALGLGLEVHRLRRRSSDYHAHALSHQGRALDEAAGHHLFLESLWKTRERIGLGRNEEPNDASERRIERLQSGALRSGRRSAYHWNLYRKYERAARRPWLPVAPDPPPE